MRPSIDRVVLKGLLVYDFEAGQRDTLTDPLHGAYWFVVGSSPTTATRMNETSSPRGGCPQPICATSRCGIERWMTSCSTLADLRRGNVDIAGQPVDPGEHVVLAHLLDG